MKMTTWRLAAAALLLCLVSRSELLGRIAFSHRIPSHATLRIDDHDGNRWLFIGMPCAESLPVFTELVGIHDTAKERDIKRAVYQSLNFGTSQFSGILRCRFRTRNPEFDIIGRLAARKDRRHHKSIVLRSQIQGWGFIHWQEFGCDIHEGFQDGALANVNRVKNRSSNFGLIGYVRKARSDLKPCPLVNFEVMPQVAPLLVSHSSISYSEWDGDALQKRFPPIHGLIPGLLGLWGTAWGWWNMRRERQLPLSGIVFVSGCALWAYSCVVLLPYVG